jgi:hypothetical protein
MDEVEGANMTHWTTEMELDSAPYRDSVTPPATASIEEIRYAQQLRLQLRERYPDLPSPPPSFWCIGVD